MRAIPEAKAIYIFYPKFSYTARPCLGGELEPPPASVGSIRSDGPGCNANRTIIRTRIERLGFHCTVKRCGNSVRELAWHASEIVQVNSKMADCRVSHCAVITRCRL
eukprot:348240-Amphidinium_carterae.1